MAQHLSGYTRGLAPSEVRRIERLFDRKVDADRLAPFELARELFRTANDLRRRIGLLITREGKVVEVAVGTKDILYLPDLGRYRLGRGRLRRVRLLFSDLSPDQKRPHIPADIYTDLEKLRLDMVIAVSEAQNRVQLAYAHLIKFEAEGLPTSRTEVVRDLSLFEFDFTAFMQELEDELAASLPAEHVLQHRDRAVLVGVYGGLWRDPQASMAELEELCRTAGVQVLDRVIQKRPPDPKTLLGKGKIEEVVLRCLRLGADMIIFDEQLKPGQWRIITNSTDLKVLDRSMLILDIFAQRATSSDGRLQVELAQLKYNLPRLVEKDTGLSRLTGGIGGRGPGETKLEIGRRRLRDRITQLERQIDKLSEQRHLRRRRRQERALPLVSILGYTNVGKSTLFNVLTRSSVLVEDKLFATLDPASRRLVVPEPQADGSVINREIVLSDTVGFIRDLPEELSSAFRATLEELHDASLLVHVLDASDPHSADRRRSVERVLTSMGLRGVPALLVLNKIDRVAPAEADALVREHGAIAVSALEKQGLAILKRAVVTSLFGAGSEQTMR